MSDVVNTLINANKRAISHEEIELDAGTEGEEGAEGTGNATTPPPDGAAILDAHKALRNGDVESVAARKAEAKRRAQEKVDDAERSSNTPRKAAPGRKKLVGKKETGRNLTPVATKGNNLGKAAPTENMAVN